MPLRSTLVLTAALAMMVAGCGSSAASPSVGTANLSTPIPLSSTTATLATAAPSPLITGTAQASPSESPGTAATPQDSAIPTETAVTPTAHPSFAVPSFTSDKELEALLPDTYQGATLIKRSFSGSDLLKTTSPQTKPITDLLASLGKSPGDLSFAFASDAAGKLKVTFGAYRIKGVDANVWLPLLLAAASAQTPGTTTSQTNVGGRAVTRIQGPTSPQGTYLYSRGDVLFFVSSADETLVGDALAALP